MESEYDLKFKEMKKYIPFLESMINRLEANSSSSTNPRQAQLDKIRSLRDLLLDKNKRMKMENLLKCEQVLVNLHNKVEQKDSFSDLKPAASMDSPKSKEKKDLEIVRNKLKTVTKLQEDDTLPEIARANDVEQYCTPGSKEPALFQRRPNIPESQSSSNVFEKSPQSQYKRNYTRVLVSPDRSSQRWPTPERTSIKPLYCRRSPARSKSPLISKKEKKKSKSSKSRKTKDLNITLNVPEEKLNSLNTKDILSRILTCSDGDVDINTLRELRSQIRDELKQTGDNNDISDLILKSYHKKTKNKKSKQKRKEVEEGELSDSESEVIDNIYGSLVVMEDGKKSSVVKSTEDKGHPRKIQICLVINKGADLPSEKAKDISEFEIQNENDTHDSSTEVISVDSDTSSSPQVKPRTSRECIQNSPVKRNLNLASPEKNQSSDPKNIISPVKLQPNDIITIEEDENVHRHTNELKNEQITKLTDTNTLNESKEDNEPHLKNESSVSVELRKEGTDNMDHSPQNKDKLQPPIKTDTEKPLLEESVSSSEIDTGPNKSTEKNEDNSKQPPQFIANFYKPLEENKDSPNLEENNEPPKKSGSEQNSEKDNTLEISTNSATPSNKNLTTKKDFVASESDNTNTHIPLLNEPTVPPKKDLVSEIDILQALKNEILSDKIAVPISETVTPTLHQPKLIKVANAQEVAPKKRISIEKYKAKSTASKPLFVKHHNKTKSGEEHKKQSLKLTEKECERFNFPKRVSLDDDNDTSDDDLLLNSDQENSLGLDDIYGDLAPKSPDNDFTSDNSTLPVIIPVDPVKTNTVSSKSDVDMRNFMPLLSPPPQISQSPVIPPSPAYNVDNRSSSDINLEISQKGSERPKFNVKDPRMRRDLSKDSPSSNSSLNPDRTPRSAPFPNMTPSYMPSMTPIMTPNARSFEMTPTHQSFELENFSKRKHVYAPSFSVGENREKELSVSRDNWDMRQNDPKGGRTSRWERDSLDAPVTPRYEDSYKYNNRPKNSDKNYRDKREGGYSRTDCPTTPIPSFGWMECPPTPASSFGRQDPPMTPSHPFGRSEYPGTPSHPFGRSDCPSTPVHPFGRSDGPQTPIHPFGRSDATTFGRQDGLNNPNSSKYNKDPRFYSRQREHESSSYNERDRSFENERSFNRGSSYRSDTFKYDRERSSYYSNDHNARHYERDRREQSDCSSLSKDSDNDRLYTRNRDSRYDGRHPRSSDVDSRRHQRERSIGRTSEYSSSARECSDRIQSTSRAPSVSRSSGIDLNKKNDNTLSFRSDTGRSLTINTSVKSTFQDFLDKPIQIFDYTFDARRQRAASVGRSLVRENNEGRAKDIERFTKRDDRFKRACSMGRELTKNKSEQSFKDIKADFESFKMSINLNNTKNYDRFNRSSSVGRELVREKSERSFKDIKSDFESFKSKLKVNTDNETSKIQKQEKPRSRKDISKSQERQSNQTPRPQYSPRKNHRDPRMQIERPGDQYSRYKIDRRSSNSHNKGIVYSNDNIAKGTIMGSGFGVKNYKIPKIKRTPEETEPEALIEKKDDTSEKTVTKEIKGAQEVQVEKIKPKNKEATKSTNLTKAEVKIIVNKIELNEVRNDSEKRVTRSKTKLVSPRLADDDSVIRKRRAKKAVILDSDSDSEKHSESRTDKNTVLKSPSKKKENKEPSISMKGAENKTNEEILESGFGIDDIEIFPENIGSDSVIDNINALIAHLDDDIDTSKIAGENFNTDIEKMIESIDSPGGDCFGDISEVIENDLNRDRGDLKQGLVSNKLMRQSDKSPINPKDQNPDNVIQPKVCSNNSYSASDLMNILKDSDKDKPVGFEKEKIDKKQTKNLSDHDTLQDSAMTITENSVNEAIVSTSEIGQYLKGSEVNFKKPQVDEGQSVPDSTINKNDTTEKSDVFVADSTNEIHCELSSDVTSTHDISETSKKELDTNSSSQLDTTSLSSIGSLLSILQDKSKIKELLAVLGDKTGENEKIMKKLERLSEIVSDDDDDTNEGQSKTRNMSIEPTDTSMEESLTNHTESEHKDENKIDQAKYTHVVCEELKAEDTNKMPEKEKIQDVPVSERNENKDDINSKSIELKQIDEEMVVGATDDSVKESDAYDADKKSQNDNDSLKCDVKNIDNKDDHDDKNNQEDEEQEDIDVEPNTKVKKTRKMRSRRSGRFKKSAVSKNKPVVKKGTNRELKKLQDDIKEMFMSDDILNATGIRMCRLAKMVHRKEGKKDDLQDAEPYVTKKGKAVGNSDENQDKIRKKPGPKAKGTQKTAKNEKFVDPKIKDSEPEVMGDKTKSLLKHKPGPKSKTKQKSGDADPYEFDTDSIADTNTTKDSEESSSDSESDSLTSSLSIGSTEVLAETKKKIRRKRYPWQTGVIKPKNRKKKEQKEVDNTEDVKTKNAPRAAPRIIPDFNCFTDKTYCFDKGLSSYECRLCEFTGEDIVNHYKKQHPHTEIPLSRMNPETAEIAIKQCEEINFQTISKIPSKKYICRFCYKEFSRKKSALELFFWHVVSNHTGEYKHLCSECVNVTRCPFNLDIPPPPKDIRGQLIGYICGKCNFTQISLENLKTHVIVRHNDEQTEVYTINLAKLSKKAMKAMLCGDDVSENPRVLRNRSIHSNQSITEASDNRDDRSEVESAERTSEADTLPLAGAEKMLMLEVPKIEPDAMKSKLTFENDEIIDDTSLKMEQEEHEADDRDEDSHFDDMFTEPVADNPLPGPQMEPQLIPEVIRNSDEIVDYPHFKLNHLESGAKEYVCCINGNDNHYKTALLISMKKHIQTKHSEKWDGYCSVCKVIVTPQGVQSDFRDCLTHLLDKHMDDFPILEKPMEAVSTEIPPLPIPERILTPPARTASPGYLAVRPLAELISKELVKEIANPPEEAPISFPKIENVVSLGDDEAVPAQSSPVYPCSAAEVEPQPQRPLLYEEFQAEVMSKKHRVVLDAMMPKNKLVRVFKCAGRFCSFTSDSADAALVHASTHQRIGGEGALNCAYCNFDACENAIDLVMHVFKVHSQCQYSCSLCFYRAAASQLVGAHHKRVHSTATPVNVLRTTGTAVPPDSTNSDNVMLSREQAVLHFICSHDDGNCNFKTFTSGKFIEHIMQRHQNVSSHPCQMCPAKPQKLQELLVHMKSHGMNLYQCTWCVHGADNEASLLSHVASRHPDKQPQAYIRVITNKDGSAQRRVLPLAFFNKTNVPQEDVSPSEATENPVREAERSIELEKLIGLTSSMVENAAPSQPTSVIDSTADEHIEPSTDSSNVIEPDVLEALTAELEPQIVKKEPDETEKRLPENAVICLDSDDEESNDPLAESRPATPIIDPLQDSTDDANRTNDEHTEEENISAGEDVTLKRVETPRTSVTEDVTITKISDDTPRKSLSDDDSGHAVIELSDEELQREAGGAPRAARVKTEHLLRCPKCRMLCKASPGLKKHMKSCCGQAMELPCPHPPCDVIIHDFRQMMDHFKSVHAEGHKFLCDVCGAPFSSLSGTKLHVRAVHHALPFVMTSRALVGGGFVTTVGALPDSAPAGPAPAKPAPSKPAPSKPAPAKPAPSKPAPAKPAPAKPATATAPAPEPALAPRPERRKYGVADADELPITPIFDHPVQCELCGFSTKVRLNMVRHLQLHAGRLPAPRSQPVNPVPHLETNEMHFDRMVNLASSSAGERPAPAAPGRYPRPVPDRQRFACGALGCSYISVDEATLRRHWEALHAGAAAFRCAHCPPEQRLDSSKPLSAARIVAHLKMHGPALYACSACAFYHFKSRTVERHAGEAHRGGARAVPVREPGAPPPPAPPAPPVPTMDLKPWRCGLCEYTSMLRPAVADHCAAAHHCKMQFKCAYCPFRTSTRENVAKHQTNAHPARAEEVVHYYYREGSLPDDADGVPRWRKQRLLLGLPELEIKEEPEPEPPAPPAAPAPAPAPAAPPAAPPVAVDLNLVKREAEKPAAAEVSLEELCAQYGQFCDPNGIKYKCCLCAAVTTQTADEMRAHLFEELGYRRLGCGLCSYKAFHAAGLGQHAAAEHPRRGAAARALAADARLERWVAAALRHQTDLIQRNRTNFAAQAIQMEKPPPPAPRNVDTPEPTSSTSDVELEHAFGKFGEARGRHFSCPRCDFVETDEGGMRNHLESELTKIRWCCTECESKFTTYHEAQFHCKSAHPGGPARPKEAVRDPAVRARWVSAVIDTQKQTLQSDPAPDSQYENIYSEPENSLLVARYDEPAQIEPERPAARGGKRAAPALDSDDDDRLVIDEPPKKKPVEKKCQYCDYSSTTHRCWREHIVSKHYNMKPYKCSLCTFAAGMRGSVLNHMEKRHPDEVHHVISVKIPNHAPPGFDAKSLKKLETDDGAKRVCLYCEKSVPESDLETHVHDDEKPEFGKRAEVVMKCLKCLELRLSLAGMRDHYASCHPHDKVYYELFKLQVDLREIHCCGHCYRKFKNLSHLKTHHWHAHSQLPLSYNSIPFNRNLRTESDNDTSVIGLAGKRKLGDGGDPPAKRTARKSTSKLPNTSVAKKSTTKLPYHVPDSETGEYSFYGTKPDPLHRYKDVTCFMSNDYSNVILDVKKLSGLMKLDPKLVVKDCKL